MISGELSMLGSVQDNNANNLTPASTKEESDNAVIVIEERATTVIAIARHSQGIRGTVQKQNAIEHFHRLHPNEQLGLNPSYFWITANGFFGQKHFSKFELGHL